MPPSPRQRLFIPGPTPIPDRVRDAMAGPLVYHRGPEFPALLTSVVDDIRKVFPATGEVFVLSASGTGAMEAAVVNFLRRGDRVLVAQAGDFGARWKDLCAAHGLSVASLDYEWGKAVRPEDVARELGKDRSIRAVFTTQSETSTGALHDVRAIGHAVRGSEALLIVDGVSSVGAHPLPLDDWGVDVAVTASQKGLMLPPGAAVVAVGPRAKDASGRADLPRYYFDLSRYRKALAEGRGPQTLPVTLVSGLRASLDLILEEGVEAVFARHARQAEAVRRAAAAVGLSVFPEAPSNALTAVALPGNIDGLRLVSRLRERFGIVVGGGLGHLRGRLLRVSNLGYTEDLDIAAAIVAVEIVLAEMGHAFSRGAGIAAAEEVLAAR